MNSLQLDAFVLHSRNYRETSQIVQIFSRQLGRQSIIAKGIQGRKAQISKALLQPFNRLQLTVSGRGDLKTLTQCELAEASQPSFGRLAGASLACGYYASELILRSCPEQHPYPQLFEDYQGLLTALLAGGDQPGILRKFEVALLTSIGLAPDWRYDLEQREIDPDQHYELVLEEGFRASGQAVDAGVELVSGLGHKSPVFCGQSILDLGSGNFRPELARSCQTITALLLKEVIGHYPLQSRQLWRQLTLLPAVSIPQFSS